MPIERKLADSLVESRFCDCDRFSIARTLRTGPIVHPSHPITGRFVHRKTSSGRTLIISSAQLPIIYERDRTPRLPNAHLRRTHPPALAAQVPPLVMRHAD